MSPDWTSTTSQTPLLKPLRAAMVVQFAAGGAVIPFVSMLMRDRGLTIGQMSLILSASSATLMVCPFLWGMLADRFVPLNRLFLWSNLGAFLALGFLFSQHTFWGLFAGFVAFTAFLNPSFTLVNALGFHHLPNPHEQFGHLRKWGSAGWIIPFLPIALWTALRPGAGLDFTLGLGMVICLGMMLLSFRLPHTPPGAHGEGDEEDGSHAYLPAVKQLFHDSNYVVLLISMFLIAGSFNLLMFYTPPFLEDLGVKRPWIGPIQAIGVVFEIVLFTWQASFLRRWNYTGLILAGCLALLMRNAMFSTLNSPWILSASFLLAGMFIVFYQTGTSMLVHHLASREVRATAQTLLSICSQGLGPMFANWAAGRIAAHYGNSFRPVFVFATLLSLLATLLILSRRKQINAIGGLK